MNMCNDLRVVILLVMQAITPRSKRRYSKFLISFSDLIFNKPRLFHYPERLVLSS